MRIDGAQIDDKRHEYTPVPTTPPTSPVWPGWDPAAGEPKYMHIHIHRHGNQDDQHQRRCIREAFAVERSLKHELFRSDSEIYTAEEETLRDPQGVRAEPRAGRLGRGSLTRDEEGVNARGRLRCRRLIRPCLST